MTIPIRQNTASQEIPLGFLLDSTDGNTEETGLTIANTDIKLWKHGATTLANKNSGGATHISNGIYYCVLDATDSNTLGGLTVFVHVTGALAIKVDCEVMPANRFDALVLGTDVLHADITQCGGSAVAAGAIPNAAADAAGGLPVSDAGGLDIDTKLANTNEITSARMGALTDWINGGRLDQIIDIIAADTTTDIPALIATAQADLDLVTGADGATLATAQALYAPNVVIPDAAGVAATPAEVATALANIHLDHLLAVNYDPASKPGVATALLNELVENDGGVSRYTANALEQAPSGGTNPNVLVDTTIAAVTDQTHFTLTAGSDEDDAYNDQAIVLYDASNSDYPSVRVISDYVGATKTVTIDAAPDFTILTGDGASVFVTAPGTTAPTVGQIRAEMEGAGNNLALILADTGTDIPARFDGVEGATFATGTDSLEAIRNRGDAAWVTGAGGSAPTVGEIRAEMEGAGYNLALILADTGELQTDWTNGGRLDLILDIIAADTTTDIPALIATAQADLDIITGADGALIASTATSAQLVDDVWDEILSGALHNIAGSAGRRLREIGAYAINSGTAQAGNSHTITLAATASAIDGTYNRNLVVLTDNTGVGQTRTIVDYNGTTKVAIIDRDWRTSPDATTAYQITADNTPLVVDQGIAQAGSATTITLRDYASSVNDVYLCNVVAIIAGAGRGQARLIGAYNGTTKVATICGDNWVTTPDTTSVYVLMPYGTTCTSCIGTSALALIKSEADDALTDYDPPTRTEATADKDAIITEVDANETKIDALQTDSTAIKAKTDNLPPGLAKNVALSDFNVYMVLSSDHVTAATGKTLTGTISKDGAAFSALTNAISEMAAGMYKVDLTQAEMNADVVTVKFTETDCDQRIITIYTS